MRQTDKYKKWRRAIVVECLGIAALLLVSSTRTRPEENDRNSAAVINNEYAENYEEPQNQTTVSSTLAIENNFIKWVDFTVSCEALSKAYDRDVASYETENHIDWIELLAYTAARTGGNFDKKALDILGKAADALAQGERTIEELTGELKYYPYYKEAYDAALGGLVGPYKIEYTDSDGNITYEDHYGLKGYFPLAAGFEYSHYDDFGAGRSYGYKRHHLGHDMMGRIGTPVIAVESGYVEALGWNQYGGWRIGIRSFDKKRYYYYAHLRQNYPYAEGLAEGSAVTAGDVIGYMGHTGYSAKENVNNIKVVHLHWGLQLIFDESQKECNSEIWINNYPLTQFLARNTQKTYKVEGTKEWRRTGRIIDPEVETYLLTHPTGEAWTDEGQNSSNTEQKSTE